MGPDAFVRLCELLRATGRLIDNKNSMAEEQLVKMPRRPKTTHVNGEESRKYDLKWSKQMDLVLIDALDELNYPFDNDHLKNQMKTLKTNFNICHDLFKGLSEFAWSPNTKLFEAELEVRMTLIEAKPSTKKWRHTAIHHYNKLSELFAKDRATSEGSISVKEKVRQWEKEGTPNQYVDVEHLDEVTGDCFEALSPHCNFHVTNSLKGIKRKASMMESLDKYAENLQSRLSSAAYAIREGNIIAERGRPHIYSKEEIYAKLLNIEVPENLQFDAFLFLIKSTAKMRALFAVPNERRYELLLKLMFPTGQPSSS
ncbi:hypothetical protein PanWU01x14_274080 [Parasponia andersonii]|uniref:Myb/SANT-like domain-containing protein n=1 Tax=Parasponia andersonii TaxID=3476 RepID=A0A2P5B3X8_PARAD|nr:hypothetical protein PanWU01x14_274080 [Parasponia andersonii]